MLHKFMQQLLMLLPPEAAHNTACFLLKHQPTRTIQTPQQKPQQLWGLHFPNPIGLAAGFDKYAACTNALLSLGFGFVEVGTLTPKAQYGNPKPRLFRLKQQQAIINRMGFNNPGIHTALNNLKQRRHHGIIGINIGKNKDTPNARALDDYLLTLQLSHPLADYITINISSPNTPKLRELFNANYLDEMLATLKQKQNELNTQNKKQVPLLLKLSPDLSEPLLQTTLDCIMKYHIDGVIATNTTTERPLPKHCKHLKETGGLSGSPLFNMSYTMVQNIHQYTHGELPIIAVGGITHPEQAHAYLDAGARLLQIYTGFIYHGPKLIREILSSLNKN